jgi:hypothetical protein
MIQFNGARRLYSSLSKLPSITADVVDTHEYKVLKSDVHIEQPIEDWDIDVSIYSLDFEKAPIGICLYLK